MCTAEHIAFQSEDYKAHTCALESFILVQLFLSRCYKQRKRLCTCLNQICMHFLTPSHKSVSMLASVIIAVLLLYKCYSVSHFLISLFSSQFIFVKAMQTKRYQNHYSENHQHICETPKIYFALIKNHSIGQLCNFYGEILLPDYILMKRHRKTWE